MILRRDKQGNVMTRLKREIRDLDISELNANELNIDELDEFSGGLAMIVAGCPATTKCADDGGPIDPNPNPYGSGGG